MRDRLRSATRAHDAQLPWATSMSNRSSISHDITRSNWRSTLHMNFSAGMTFFWPGSTIWSTTGSLCDWIAVSEYVAVWLSCKWSWNTMDSNPVKVWTHHDKKAYLLQYGASSQSNDLVSHSIYWSSFDHGRSCKQSFETPVMEAEKSVFLWVLQWVSDDHSDRKVGRSWSSGGQIIIIIHATLLSKSKCKTEQHAVGLM